MKVTFRSAEDQTIYLGEVKNEEELYSFKNGERYLLSVTSSFSVNPPVNVYLWDLATGRFRGSMPVTMFHILAAYDLAPEVEPQEEVPEEAAVDMAEQLSLFF